MPWFLLIIGGLFEIGFTTSLRFVDGFRNVPWTIAFLVSVSISMALLELAARTIPMGTAYAVWGGIGALGTVVEWRVAVSGYAARAESCRRTAHARDLSWQQDRSGPAPWHLSAATASGAQLDERRRR